MVYVVRLFDAHPSLLIVIPQFNSSATSEFLRPKTLYKIPLHTDIQSHSNRLSPLGQNRGG